jgi:hypothetical protein
VKLSLPPCAHETARTRVSVPRDILYWLVGRMSGTTIIRLFDAAVVLIILVHWYRARRLVESKYSALLWHEYRATLRSSNAPLLAISIVSVLSAPAFLILDWAPPLIIETSLVLGFAFALYFSWPPTVFLLGPTDPKTVEAWETLRDSCRFTRVLVALDPWKLSHFQTGALGTENARVPGRAGWLMSLKESRRPV